MTAPFRGVVDSHVHLLPVRLNQAIRAFFAREGVDPASFAYPIDPAVVCELLAGEGITAAWTLPYVRRPGAAEQLNADVAAIAAARATGPVAVVAGCTVHPADSDPVAVVRRAVEDGGARALKLHCSVGDFSPDDGRLDPVWSWVSACRLPVVVHAGHGVSGHTEADELAPVATVASRWPDARVVVAHCGHRAAATTVELLAAHPSLYADLTPVVSELVDVPEAAASVAERLLFGSDAPNTAVPVGAALAAVGRLGLDERAAAGVRGANAQRLLDEIAV